LPLQIGNLAKPFSLPIEGVIHSQPVAEGLASQRPAIEQQ